jgi:hypothetical protein
VTGKGWVRMTFSTPCPLFKIIDAFEDDSPVITQKLGGTKMTTKRLVQSMFIILFFLYAIPALAGEVVFYDNNGKLVDKTGYEKVVKERSQKIERIMEEGYGNNAMKLEDPILLRKRRLQQWKEYRETLGKMKS